VKLKNEMPPIGKLFHCA